MRSLVRQCGLGLALGLLACNALEQPRASAAAKPKTAAHASRPATTTVPATHPLSRGPRAVTGTHGVVTSVEAQATRAGIRILEQGGNAVDAAVAVAYALAVTHPSAGNIGGGGFMLVKLAGQRTVAIDFRETAPRLLTRDRFDRMIRRGGAEAAAIGIPGSVAGLNLALERYGRLPRAIVMAPAIELAAKGHRVGQREAQTLRWSWPVLKRDPGSRRTYAAASGDMPVAAGAFLRRPELARTLSRIAERGDAGFYDGPVATALSGFVRAKGGVVSEDDLRGYRASVREPLHIDYRGYTVEIMPPPSAGGVVVAQTLLMLRELEAQRLPREAPEQLHLFIEASRRAQAERRFAVVDPDALAPAELARRLANFEDPHYLFDREPRIDRAHATPSERVHPLFAALLRELEHTTHFAVSDADGNVVSCTTTLSASFGAKRLVPELGVILNNSVASFASMGENQPVAGRRTTSSMAPTLLLDGDHPVLVLGSPGGDTIPSTVVQVLRNMVDYGMALEDAVDAPRLHHGFAPDVVRFERERPPSKAVLAGLAKLGHQARAGTAMGDANAIVLRGRDAFAYADPREGGLALAAEPAKRAEPESPLK